MAREVAVWFEKSLKENNVYVEIDWKSAGVDDVDGASASASTDSTADTMADTTADTPTNPSLKDPDSPTESNTTLDNPKATKKRQILKSHRKCEICNSLSTPMWRRGPSGNLCFIIGNLCFTIGNLCFTIGIIYLIPR
jgi:hypothetical protein